MSAVDRQAGGQPGGAGAAATPHALGESGARIARRADWSLGLGVGGANLVGGIVVFAFLRWVVPTPVPRTSEVTRLNLELFVPFMALAWMAGAVGTRLAWRPVRRWLRSAGAPVQREVARALRLPLILGAMSAAIWLVAATFSLFVNAHFSWGLGAETAIITTLGGIVTSSLAYLLSERSLRPVTARALAAGFADRPALPGVATRMLLAWAFGTGVVLLDIVLIAIGVLAGTPASTQRLAVTVLVLSISALVIGLASILIAARSVADPLESVRAALAQVELGDLETETPVFDASEVGLLQAGFNQMAVGLRERERLRELFGRHVGVDVARQAIERGVQLGGETRDVAVLFVDLIGSTSLAATRDPQSVVSILNRFFAVVVDEISARGGWVNKFEGDAALCVFGAPDPLDDAAARALATARTMRERLLREVPDVRAAIGLSAGPVVCGNVGAAERFEYTVIGDAVNEVARLTELAKEAPARLLASEAILERAGAVEGPHWRLGDEVVLRGRDQPTRLAAPAHA